MCLPISVEYGKSEIYCFFEKESFQYSWLIYEFPISFTAKTEKDETSKILE